MYDQPPRLIVHSVHLASEAKRTRCIFITQSTHHSGAEFLYLKIFVLGLMFLVCMQNAKTEKTILYETGVSHAYIWNLSVLCYLGYSVIWVVSKVMSARLSFTPFHISTFSTISTVLILQFLSKGFSFISVLRCIVTLKFMFELCHEVNLAILAYFVDNKTFLSGKKQDFNFYKQGYTLKVNKNNKSVIFIIFVFI